MKKTLLATCQFPPDVGGTETLLYNVAKRLDPDKLVVLANRASGAAAIDSKQQYKTVRETFLYRSKLVWPRWLPLLKAMYRAVESEEIEEILAGQVLPVGTAAMRTAQKFDIPYSVCTYGMDIEIAKQHPRHKKTLVKVLENATRIFTISEDTKRRITDIGIPEKKIVKIAPGLNTKEFIPPPS